MPRFDIRASKIEPTVTSQVAVSATTAPSLYRPETFFSFLRGRQRTEETVFSFQKVSQKKIPLDLDECEMHVKVPLIAFIVVFVRALDKQTPLSS